MAGKERYTAQDIIEALRATKGMVYLAAERLGCHAKTIHNYAQRYPTVMAELETQNGIVNDTAELKLIQAIHNGEAWAIKYRLSTKGKDRGYTERQEITGADGGPVDYRDVTDLTDEELALIAARGRSGAAQA